MKPAVPREIVNAGGGFEEDDRRSLGGRRVTGDEFRHARDLEIVEAADESAFEALDEEIGERGRHLHLPIEIEFHLSYSIVNRQLYGFARPGRKDEDEITSKTYNAIVIGA